MKTQLLDPITLPIQGQCLIEASAGTGKTFTLAALYLRLLLGLGKRGEQGQENTPLGVEQILVVTFTEAATQELRDRIRQRIREARIAFMSGETSDPFLQSLLAQTDNHREKARLMELAAAEMDQAAIFTIHGFCQRMLKQHAFESGALFNQELTPDDAPLVRQALLDVWRNLVYPLTGSLANAVLDEFKTPEALLKSIKSLLGMSNVTVEPDYSHVDLEAEWAVSQQAREAFKQVWRSNTDDLAEIIATSGIKKAKYRSNHVPGRLEKIAFFVDNEFAKLPLNELNYFRTSELHANTPEGKTAPTHPVFDSIEQMLTAEVPIKGVIESIALARIRGRLQYEKARHQLLAFDDLLTRLAGALKASGGSKLAETIRHQYPIAMIDEFQDTDPLQYQIFSDIYTDPAAALLMIGDPKQSIYAFRGGDIFTYMQARRAVDAHYTLETNWRSSSAMVCATNTLFEQSDAPFIYSDDIPFVPVRAAGKADKQPFLFDGQPQPALTAWLSSELLQTRDYLSIFAESTASHIATVLNDQRYTIGDKQVKPGDIAVLVRDRREAGEIQSALRNNGVASVFLSNRDSVYTTVEASEMLFILQAVLEPTDERKLRAAIATGLFCLSMTDIDKLIRDELAWEQLVDEFIEYRQLWLRLGVLPMVHHLLATRGLTSRLMQADQGERRLTDFLHLAELLQQASQEVEGEQGIIRWLTEHLHSPNHNSAEQQLRLESDRSRVTVITIHKSKGLEYELVYLPFICRYRAASGALYHNDAGQTIFDLAPDDDVKEQVEKERLAEDLRLLYVAVTRAVHACFLGVSNIRYGNSKQGTTEKSALGYLLMSQSSLEEGLEQLSNAEKGFRVDSPPEMVQIPSTQDMFADNGSSKPVYQARIFSAPVERDWRMSSYSALSRFHDHVGHEAPPSNHFEPISELHLDLEVIHESENDKTDGAYSPENVASEPRSASLFDAELEDLIEAPDSIFTFPRGATAGTFLHTLFEEIDFSQLTAEAAEAVLTDQLPLAGYDERWVPVLRDYLLAAVHIPLNPDHFCLADISLENRLVEMEFIIPFKPIHAGAVNRLLAKYDPLAKQAGDLRFETVQGMLKGYIDLTLRHHGQYYVLDYKSNHLGDRVEEYSTAAMEEAMCEHRYDFQYVLYTLALHRLLKVRLPGYDYDRDVGGVYYLFLRGLHAEHPGNGVFFTKPKKALIEALDQLFTEGVTHAIAG